MKFLLQMICLSGLLLVNGCGYHIGSMMHPQVKSIGVAPVVNDTAFFNSASVLRSMLCETFMTDGSLKLKDVKKADCIIYARVTGIKFSEVSIADSTEERSTYNAEFTPNQWKVTVDVQFSVEIPGRAKSLISLRKATGSAKFENSVDMQTARENGVRQALYQAARNIAAQVTEAW